MTLGPTQRGDPGSGAARDQELLRLHGQRADRPGPPVDAGDALRREVRRPEHGLRRERSAPAVWCGRSSGRQLPTAPLQWMEFLDEQQQHTRGPVRGRHPCQPEPIKLAVASSYDRHEGGVPWWTVAVPPEDHACWTQTATFVIDHSVIERCPCGARQRSRPGHRGEWTGRNTRGAAVAPGREPA